MNVVDMDAAERRARRAYAIAHPGEAEAGDRRAPPTPEPEPEWEGVVAAPLSETVVAAVRTLRFYSPVELASITHPEPEWVVGPGLAALGAITEIDGKIKRAGKTTLLLDVARSILDGLPFLGCPTRKCRVVYVTEQSRQTFSDALRRAGLNRRGDELLILFREDIGVTSWADVVASTRQDGYEVNVFDTLSKLAGIKEENSAGEWAAAMVPLQDLAASGRAVFAARHDRKSGGDVGDSGRGSSQASGDVDIILALRRPEGNQPTTRRVIESLSRYSETPEKIVIDLTDQGYVLLGTDEAVAAADTRLFVSSAIGAEFRTKRIGLDTKTLEELASAHVPPIPRTSLYDALAWLFAKKEVTRTGRGVKGDRYIYGLPSEDVQDVSSGTHGPKAGRIETDQTEHPIDLQTEMHRIFGDDLVGEA